MGISTAHGQVRDARRIHSLDNTCYLGHQEVPEHPPKQFQELWECKLDERCLFLLLLSERRASRCPKFRKEAGWPYIIVCYMAIAPTPQVENPKSKRPVWNLDFGSWILGFGSWIWGFGFWILDCCSIRSLCGRLKRGRLDFGSWISGFGFWICCTVWILHSIIATTRRLGSVDYFTILYWDWPFYS